MSPGLRSLLLASLVAVVAFAGGWFLGRGRASDPSLAFSRPAPEGPTVATFEGGAIGQEELGNRLLEMGPVARARYQSVEQRREYVEGLARFALLAREAQARGLHQHPDVVETARKVMVQRLLAQELDQGGGEPTDAELNAFYERHKADYVKPEQLRLSHLFLAVPPGDAAAAKAQRAKAELLLAEVRKLQPMDFRAFGALASKHSEEPRTRPLEGDLRFLSETELAEQYGAPVAEAAKGLKTPGEVSGIVETDRGLHLLKLRAREAPLNLDAAQVRSQLTARVQYEKRTERYEKLLESLRRKYALKIDEQALAQLQVDLSAPARPPSGPPPGFIPPPRPQPPAAGSVGQPSPRAVAPAGQP